MNKTDANIITLRIVRDSTVYKNLIHEIKKWCAQGIFSCTIKLDWATHDKTKGIEKTLEGDGYQVTHIGDDSFLIDWS